MFFLLQISHFTQHFVDQLDLEVTPLYLLSWTHFSTRCVRWNCCNATCLGWGTRNTGRCSASLGSVSINCIYCVFLVSFVSGLSCWKRIAFVNVYFLRWGVLLQPNRSRHCQEARRLGWLWPSWPARIEIFISIALVIIAKPHIFHHFN